jgi:DNA-directed RNA polymerase subunit RPC12/RpoP
MYTVDGKKYDFDSCDNQNIKSKLVQREVYCNVNSMAEYILSKSWEDSDAPFSYDDIENYYQPVCPRCGYSSNFEKIETEIPDDDDFVNISYKCENCDEELDEINELDTQAQDIFEWWLVSDWLAEKFADKGEPVLVNKAIWGRTCTGQAILLDYVISQIAYEMEILEWQKYSWEGK